MSVPTDLQELERFVIENDDLQELEARIGRFNVFDALGVARAEIRHSNFLAWLLDPQESHGHGDLFLKSVLMDLLRRGREQGCEVPISPVELDGTELRGVEIRREWRNIDLLVISTQPSFVVVIENKVGSGEHSGQLDKYKAVAKTTFAKIPAMFVFLTVSGDEASDDDWVNYTYADLFAVLSRVRRQSAGSLGGDVGVFFDHYLNLIEGRFMEDQELMQLCRRIYANHRRAINLINLHAPVDGAEGLTPIREWFEQRPKEWLIRASGPGYLQAIAKSWIGKICDKDGEPLKNSACDAYIECTCRERESTRVKSRLVIGPGENSQRRLAVIKALTSPPFNLAMQRKAIAPVWTRLESKTLLRWDPDAETPSEQIAKVFADWMASLGDAVTKLPVLAST